MTDDIQYRVLDATCILRRCLHNGPVPLTETQPDNPPFVEAESEARVDAGTIDVFLKALVGAYGAYGFVALDGDQVVGKVRFYPSALAEPTKATS